MALTSAMLTGFTGIKSNQTTVNTVGDDIANLNTTAFKQQRTLFETLMYETISPGSGPSPGTGGTLPRQVGRGSGVAAVQRDFAQGAIEATGSESDLALNGRGFFVLSDADGALRYTRDGAFVLDPSSTLVATGGRRVQGYAADAAGQIQRGALTDIVIPLGEVAAPVATSEAVISGKLDAAEPVASVGHTTVSQALRTSGGSAATATTALTDLVDEHGAPLFSTDDAIEIVVNKGGGSLPPETFIVGTTGSTLGDFASYLQTIAGVYADPTVDPAAGVTVAAGPDPEAGSLVVTSNRGEANALRLHREGDELEFGSILNRTKGTTPFSFSTRASAVGGGTSTNFTVYDSLGQPVEARLRFALETKDTGGTTWRYYAESLDDSDLSPLIGTGTVQFDASGRFVTATGDPLSLDRAGSGASSPLTFSLDFSGMTAPAESVGESRVYMASQDGTPAGELEGYEIDEDGVITGKYSNQQSRVLGQVAVATFINNEGLLAESENTYVPGANSGDANIVAANEAGAGAIVAGALEQSNVELVREFIDLVSASTGISAASRVVRTADDLLQELLLLSR